MILLRWQMFGTKFLSQIQILLPTWHWCLMVWYWMAQPKKNLWHHSEPWNYKWHSLAWKILISIGNIIATQLHRPKISRTTIFCWSLLFLTKNDFMSTSLQLPLQFWNWCCSKFVWQASSISKQHRHTICKWNRGMLPFSGPSKYLLGLKKIIILSWHQMSV